MTSSSLTHSVPRGLLYHEVDPCRIGDVVHDNNFGHIEIDPDTNRIEVSLFSAKTGERLVNFIVDHLQRQGGCAHDEVAV